MKKNTQAAMHLVKSKQTCENCDIESLCISAGIDEKYTNKLNEIVKLTGPFDAGELIYRRGDSFKSLYVIQNGVAKSQTDSVDGRQQVTGFYFPGDLIGIESISNNVQPCDVIAMERTWLCEVPFTKLEDLCSRFPGLQHELFMRMGKRIHYDEYNRIVNRSEPAEKRISGFLSETFQKLSGTKYVSGNCLQLPMTKADIASHLGIQPETLSRSLKKLQEQGDIINAPNHIEILDLDAMIKASEN